MFRRLFAAALPGALVRAKSVLGGLHHEYSVSRRSRRSRMEYGPLNRMTETAQVLKSGVALAGWHFCGGAPGDRQGVKGASP